jgi:hypothetical protein
MHTRIYIPTCIYACQAVINWLVRVDRPQGYSSVFNPGYSLSVNLPHGDFGLVKNCGIQATGLGVFDVLASAAKHSGQIPGHSHAITKLWFHRRKRASLLQSLECQVGVPVEVDFASRKSLRCRPASTRELVLIPRLERRNGAACLLSKARK